MMHSKANQVLHRIQGVFFRYAMWFEVIIALIIFFGIVIHLYRLPELTFGNEALSFNAFLQYLLEALIGLEVVMMLCRHDLDSIMEAMIFAVAKNLLVIHESTLGVLIGVLALAVLFAIRKFLFISGTELLERRKHSDYIQRDK